MTEKAGRARRQAIGPRLHHRDQVSRFQTRQIDAAGEGVERGAERSGHDAALEVRRSNEPARRLYERLGFEVAATRPNYYVSPPEDALILWKSALKPSQSSA